MISVRHRKPPHTSRTLITAVIVVLGLAIVGIGIYATQTGINHDADQQQRTSVAESTAFDLAQQVKSACSNGQLHGPICSDAVAVAPPGATGATGAAGAVGPRGEPGITPPCFFEPTQCRGPAGTNGKDGANGTNGVDGKDGKDGADGAPGPVGPQGPEGPAGPMGPAAPTPTPEPVIPP